MDEFDRYHLEDQNSGQPSTNDSARENKGGEHTPARDGSWYSVSYQNESWQPFEMEQEKRERARRRNKLALISLIVAVCVLFSAVMGLGGYLIADHLSKNLQQGDPNGQGGIIQPGSGTGGGTSGTVYEATGAESYDYKSVVISKNNGTGLAGSTNGSAGENATTRIAAVAAVRDAVVEITTTTVSNRGQLTAGAGSGVIIHADGIIVTNNHVIEGVSSIYVRLTNGNTYEAYLRGTDEDNDIAILKITPKETLTVAKLGYSGALAYGEDVFAIGNPLGQLGGTVTEGIISALSREVEMDDGAVMTLLQTSAAINSGNSGGGLFNMAGELIGVVNAKYSATGVEGLGFAIPVDTAILSINLLLEHGYIPGIPSIGATIVDSTMQVSYFEYVKLPYVYAAEDDSALQAGDWIYKINDTAVSTVSALKRAVRSYRIGDTVTLTIYRNNRQQTVEVTLIEYIPDGVSVSFN